MRGHVANLRATPAPERKAPKKVIQREVESVIVTPEMATELLERNTSNRTLRQHHVDRIAKAIKEGRWQFNGDTIKIRPDGVIADGQHRLWAIVEAGIAVESLIVYGIGPEAFATMDTIRAPRLGKDLLGMNGVARYQSVVSTALTWLLRWQSGRVMEYRDPKNRIEVSHIEAAFASHPNMPTAVERVHRMRELGNLGVLAFLYYLLSNRNAELADRMITTLEEPATAGRTDPFFKLREYLLGDGRKGREPLLTIALAIKAANAAHRGERIERLRWHNQGSKAEAMPELSVGEKH